VVITGVCNLVALNVRLYVLVAAGTTLRWCMRITIWSVLLRKESLMSSRSDFLNPLVNLCSFLGRAVFLEGFSSLQSIFASCLFLGYIETFFYPIFWGFIDQHVQFSSLILVILDLVPSEFYVSQYDQLSWSYKRGAGGNRFSLCLTVNHYYVIACSGTKSWTKSSVKRTTTIGRITSLERGLLSVR